MNKSNFVLLLSNVIIIILISISELTNCQQLQDETTTEVYYDDSSGSAALNDPSAALVSALDEPAPGIGSDDDEDEIQNLATKPHEFPWMVSIEIFFTSSPTSKHCGATLISDLWLLTAANCVVLNGKAAYIVIASLGKHNIGLNREPRELRHFVSFVTIHPHYTTDTNGVPQSFDIALLKLNSPVKFTPQIRPLNLFENACQMPVRYTEMTSTVDNCRIASTLSWLPFDSTLERNFLKKINLPIQPFVACTATSKQIYFSHSKLCAGGDDDGVRSCLVGGPGDPLLCRNSEDGRWFQIGVLSFRNSSFSCSSNNDIPRVYSRVCAALPWIKTIMGPYTSVPVTSNQAQQKTETEPLIKCENLLPHVRNGHIANGTSAWGDRREIICDPGYVIYGPSTIICGDDAEWSNPGRCYFGRHTTTTAATQQTTTTEMALEVGDYGEMLQCTVPYLRNGYFLVDGITVAPYNRISPNKTVILRCSVGFFAGSSANQSSVCQINGLWRPPFSHCINPRETTTQKLPTFRPNNVQNTPKPYQGYVKIASPASFDQQVVDDHFKRKYFNAWQKRYSKNVFSMPSDVQAMMKIQNPDRPAETLSLIVVCYHGEILELSHTNFSRIQWKSSVFLPQMSLIPRDENETSLAISHAVYDEETDEIFMTLSSHPSGIYRASRAELEADLVDGGVELRYLVWQSKPAKRLFTSLAMDAVSRLLYACDDLSSEGAISVWFVPIASSTTMAKLLGIIKTRHRPSYIDIHFATADQLYHMYSSGSLAGSEDNDDSDISAVMLLAVSSTDDNAVELLATDFTSFSQKLEYFANRNYTQGSTTGVIFNSTSLSLKSGFCNLGAIAQWNHSDINRAGSVYGPREVHFDQAGRLFVADDRNFRLQIFEMKGERSRIMAPSWVAQETGWQLWSFAIVMQNATTGRISALVSKYNEILAFE